MSAKRLLLKNTIINLLGYLYLLVASFFSIPWILRSLGTEKMGEYLLIIALPILLSIVDFGLVSSSVYHMAKGVGERKKIFSSSFFSMTLIAVILSLVAYTVTGISFGRADLSLPIAVLTFVTVLSETVLISAQSSQNYTLYSLRTYIVGTANTFGTAYILSLFPTISSAVWTQVVAHLITIVITIYILRNEFKNFAKPDRQSLVSLVKYGVVNWVTQITGQVQSYAGKYALGRLISSSAVTPFGIAQALIAKLSGAIITAVKAFFPAASALAGRGDKGKIRKILLSSELLIFTGGLVGIVLNHWTGLPLLAWWLGDAELSVSVFSIVSILLIYFVSSSITIVPSMLANGLGYPGIPSFFAVTTVVLELVLLVILTPMYGVLGPAYAATIASIVNTPPFLYMIWKKLNEKT